MIGVGRDSCPIGSVVISINDMATEFQRSDRQIYRFVAGEHLLVDLHSKAEAPFFAITPSAVVLWQELASWTTEGRLAALLRERYGISEEQAVTDVRDFLEQLDEIAALDRRGAGQ